MIVMIFGKVNAKNRCVIILSTKQTWWKME